VESLHPAYYLAAALAATLLFVLARASWRRRMRSRRAKRRGRRAVRGEREAEALLVRRGYEIEDRQASMAWTIYADGEPVDIELRADLIVRRDDRRLVAEVKTGEMAPSLANAATRRQLLEYRVAYDVDGIVLVDVEGDELIDVEFPGLAG
jgi:hypothetical protein